MPATVWTPYRKWMGNLIPAVVWMIPATFGVFKTAQTHQLAGIGLIYLIAATVMGWLALNAFGLYQNARMRRRLLAILGKSNDLPTERFFVGFSSPKFWGALDAHEDVGFLCFLGDGLVFVSETRTVDIKNSEIQNIGFRLNIHSMVGLGRWISVDGLRNGQPLRMLIEPRERNTMLGNLLYGKQMLSRLRQLVTQAS